MFSKRAVAIAGAAAACVVGFGSPAMADTGHSYGMGTNCPTSSDGWFVSNGDDSYIKDTCADGFSAVLKVDVYPLKSGGGYDFLVWNSNGAGTTVWDNSHDFTEGMTICIQAGVGHPGGEWGGFGSWKCDRT